MAKKKTTTWYGIKTPRESLKIFEVEVVKVEGPRLLIAQDTLGPLSKPWVYNSSAYEQYFKTREKAVKVKRDLLEKDVANATENAAQAARCLRDFERQEKL